MDTVVAIAPRKPLEAGTTASEMSVLGERLVYLVTMRAFFVLVAAALISFMPGVLAVGRADGMSMVGAYVVCYGLLEGLRRKAGGRSNVWVAGALLLDGLFLHWLMYATGGPDSKTVFLIYVHLIAVTLLTSYSTGLKVALWHSLLFFGAFYSHVLGFLPSVVTLDGKPTELAIEEFNVASIVTVGAFVLIALSTAAFSAVNERELRKRKADVEAFADLAEALEGIRDPRLVAQALLRHLQHGIGFKDGLVLGIEPDHLELLAQVGRVGVPPPWADNDPILKQTARSDQILKMRQLDSTSSPVLGKMLPTGRNVFLAPLDAESETLAILAFEHDNGRLSYEERRTIAMVNQFVSHASLALRNTRLLQEMYKLVETDPLTGLANRRAFARVLEAELNRAARQGQEVSLVMFDIDHFKDLNDRFGHQAGDAVLHEVGKVFKMSCRDFDVAARYGGEEFAVVLPACPPSQAPRVAERLRLLLSKVEAVRPITASAGVASFPQDADSVDELISKADAALYESKQTGRDRTTPSPYGWIPEPPAAPSAPDPSRHPAPPRP